MSSTDPTTPADDDAPQASPPDQDAVLDAAEPAGVPLPSDAPAFDADDMYPPDSVQTLVLDDEPSLFARLGVEALGSFGLVFAGVGAALYAGFTTAGALGVSLMFGLALFVLVAAFGSVSWHFNPVVTFGAAIAGRAPWVEVVPYVLAQLVGGALAVTAHVLVLRSLPDLTPDVTSQVLGGAANGFGAQSPIGFGILGAIIIEVIVTAIFVAVVLAVGRRALAAPAIGLAYAVGIFVAFPITNGSLNPVRSTVVSIFAGGEYVSQLWVFWVAPLLGAAIAGLVYGLVRPAADDVLLDDLDIVEEDADRPGVVSA